MNKDEFWKILNKMLDNSDLVGVAWSSFLRVRKGGDEEEDIEEIDYKQYKISFDELISLLYELKDDGLIKIISTENIGFYIEKND